MSQRAVNQATVSGEGEASPRAAIRTLGGYAVMVVGVVLELLGWYGISGTAEVARQVPYLASATIPGAALLVGGALMVAIDRSRRSSDRAADMVATLYRLLTEAIAQPSGASTSAASPAAVGIAAGFVALADGTRYHRPECALVVGKARVESVDTDAIRERALQPCPICEPAGAVGAADD